MSAFFDELARSLATPMPRRRALRTLGAALAVGVVGGARPARGATALTCDSPGVCPAGTTAIGKTCQDSRGESWCALGCCHDPNGKTPKPVLCTAENPTNPCRIGAWCCPAGWTCGKSPSDKSCLCPGRRKCGETCCKPKDRCVKGKCCPAIRTTFAPGTNGKGVACCPPGTIAVPGGAGLCCRKGDLDCCKSFDPRQGDDIAPLGPGRGKLCVNGRIRKA